MSSTPPFQLDTHYRGSTQPRQRDLCLYTVNQKRALINANNMRHYRLERKADAAQAAHLYGARGAFCLGLFSPTTIFCDAAAGERRPVHSKLSVDGWLK